MSIKSQKHKAILITGGLGNLGRELKQLISSTAIDREDLDITDETAVRAYLERKTFDIIIHCAAFSDVDGAEKDKEACYRVNVTGTKNLVTYFKGSKFIYISTDYVFDGERGNYKEDDATNPVNYYAETKLMGENDVKKFPHTLIIRTTFKPNGPWPFPKAFSDQWTSADFVADRAPQILKAALMPNLFGLIHIGGIRKTTNDLAAKVSPNVGKMSINDIEAKLPHDVSLDSSYWHSLQM